MRSFEYAVHQKTGEQMYKLAEIPEYQTISSAGADFFCAEDVSVPSIWKSVAVALSNKGKEKQLKIQPTLVHTGIKAKMEPDEVLEIYNRSSNPKKLGLILANSVGIIDADYYGNPDNDGEIMFAFYNFMPWDVTVKQGDRIGQGIFKKFLRPTENLRIKDATRSSGFGSTGK